jgi:hypothetical protein
MNAARHALRGHLDAGRHGLPPRRSPPNACAIHQEAASPSAREFDDVAITSSIALRKGRVTGRDAADLLKDERAEANDLVRSVVARSRLAAPPPWPLPLTLS